MFIDFFVRFIVIIALFAGCTYFFISYNNKKNGRLIERKTVLALLVFAAIMITLIGLCILVHFQVYRMGIYECRPVIIYNVVW